jgi:cell division protein ZipA
MASMVKPGGFPFEQMGTFTCPGLALFVQLPGARPPLVLYDEMLEAAERLAALLDGRIMNEKRKPLTRNERERMRERLAE